MANLNVTVVGPPEYAREIGKKGTETDITFYNLKREQDTVTLMEPSRYPERLAPLFYSASMAHFAIVVVERIDHVFGETILMLDSCGVDRGMIVLRNYLVKEQVTPLIEGTVAENYEFFEDDPIEIRGRLFQEMDLASVVEGEGGSVPIDHHFNVKGVGTVILGSVARGRIRKHDKMRVLPGEGTATLRSIQKHDDDFEEAVEGERVGLALKGVDSDDLDRGFVITTEDDLSVIEEARVDMEICRFWSSPLKEGMVLHIGHWMQFMPCRVVSVDAGEDWRRGSMTLCLDKELVHPPGAGLVLTYLDGGKLRVVGRARLV
jgi:selenocysteine-specific translation elongation factor